MTACVSHLWRHPIKAHGREALTETYLTAGQCLPWDRHWAVTHTASKFDTANPEWAHCGNFMRGASTPELSAISTTWDEATGQMTLNHPDLNPLQFHPDTEAEAFLDWVRPLSAGEARRPAALVSAPGRGMTDSAHAGVSIMSLASHAAVEGQMDMPLDIERWRGNIWVDGFDAWAEWNWIGKTLRLGEAEVTIRKPIERCKQIMSNPNTGRRDADILRALFSTWDHRNFGVQALVSKSGRVAVGDPVEVL